MEHDLFGKPASTFPDHALTAADNSGVVDVTSRRDIGAGVIAMDSAAAEFGAVRRVDVAVPFYTVGFDISVPLLLQFGRCINSYCAALPVAEHRLAGKGWTGCQETGCQ